MHRANPFIVVVVVVVVVVQLLLFVSLRRDSLPSRWSRSIDRSINSRANRMDLKEMLTWHSDAFSRSTFSLSQKKRPLDQQRQNVKKSSFENHSRNRRLKTTIHTLPELVAETTTFVFVFSSAQTVSRQTHTPLYYTKGKKARTFCVQKSFPNKTHQSLLLEKNTQKKPLSF